MRQKETTITDSHIKSKYTKREIYNIKMVKFFICETKHSLRRKQKTAEERYEIFF